jgi:RHS repeat-associated protein
VDKNANVVEVFDYYPFGAELRSTVNDDQAANLRFTGKELDKESHLGLYYFGARYYDPEVGRFIGVDPLADKKPWLTSYHYCSNNPISNIDPNGLDDYYYDSEGNQVEYRKKHWLSALIFGNEDRYYMEGSEKANHEFKGKNYWEIETALPKDLQGSMEGVVENFETLLNEFVDENAAEGSFPFNFSEVLNKSPENRAWDMKNKKGFERDKIYVLDNKGYFNDYVGNVAWAMIMKNSGWPMGLSILGAGLNQTFMQKNPSTSEKISWWINHPMTFGDDIRDTRAIVHGYYYK